jgi:hypothetical protein
MTAHPELDVLTEGLVPAVDALGRQVAMLADVATGQRACPWCLEGAGWCSLTGGTHPCEGAGGHAAAMLQAASSPTVRIHIGETL